MRTRHIKCRVIHCQIAWNNTSATHYKENSGLNNVHPPSQSPSCPTQSTRVIWWHKLHAHTLTHTLSHTYTWPVLSGNSTRFTYRSRSHPLTHARTPSPRSAALSLRVCCSVKACETRAHRQQSFKILKNNNYLCHRKEIKKKKKKERKEKAPLHAFLNCGTLCCSTHPTLQTGKAPQRQPWRRPVLLDNTEAIFK